MSLRGRQAPFPAALAGLLLALLAGAHEARGAGLRAGKGSAFPTLASALHAADSGDTIVLGPGVYAENGLMIGKPVTLRGEGYPVLDARGGGTILDIRSDRVRVSGLVFRDVGFSSLKEHGAIWITGVSDAVVEDCRFERCFFGVYGAQARRLAVRRNRIEGVFGKEATTGNGIHLWKCDSVTADGNEVRGHRDGMYFEFTANSSAAGNLCERNVRYGLHFMYAHGNRYDGNVFRSNGSGVAVMYSRGVHMRNNRFEANWGAASYGVLLKSIKDSRIEGNVFDRNTVAVFQEGSSGLAFEGNRFRSNGWALRIVADCDRNAYAANRFEGNTFDVAYNASAGNSNIFRRNAWDRYQGWDLDHDGLGDVAHRPVELFPTLMQDHPQAMALLRSHFVTLLNAVERMFPTLSPATLEDTEPLMPAARRRGA
jgi:nitrous oxidase accessory protein